MSSPAPMFLITGIMAAGKSSVAQALAERFERSVHVRGDTFRRSIVGGRADMSAEPSGEALHQLDLRYRLAAQIADAYVDAGFVAVLQDVVVGPTLDTMIGHIRTRPLAVVVLAPSIAVVEAREAGRRKVAYTGFTPADLDAELRGNTTRHGLWVDSSELTVDETVDRILRDVPDHLLADR